METSYHAQVYRTFFEEIAADDDFDAETLALSKNASLLEGAEQQLVNNIEDYLQLNTLLPQEDIDAFMDAFTEQIPVHTELTVDTDPLKHGANQYMVMVSASLSLSPTSLDWFKQLQLGPDELSQLMGSALSHCNIPDNPVSPKITSLFDPALEQALRQFRTTRQAAYVLLPEKLPPGPYQTTPPKAPFPSNGKIHILGCPTIEAPTYKAPIEPFAPEGFRSVPLQEAAHYLRAHTVGTGIVDPRDPAQNQHQDFPVLHYKHRQAADPVTVIINYAEQLRHTLARADDKPSLRPFLEQSLVYSLPNEEQRTFALGHLIEHDTQQLLEAVYPEFNDKRLAGLTPPETRSPETQRYVELKALNDTGSLTQQLQRLHDDLMTEKPDAPRLFQTPTLSRK